MRIVSILVIVALAALPRFAPGAELTLDIEVPRLDVAEYHRPYVAVWVEDGDRQVVANLAVWYEVSNEEGHTWLKDMRQWWRRSGRALEVPVDGLTGATRAPGTHRLSFSSASGALASVPAGEYRLLVEAAREVGGRELLEFDLRWPPEQASRSAVQGERELGELTLVLSP